MTIAPCEIPSCLKVERTRVKSCPSVPVRCSDLPLPITDALKKALRPTAFRRGGVPGIGFAQPRVRAGVQVSAQLRGATEQA